MSSSSRPLAHAFLGLLAVSLCLIAWDGAHRRRTHRLNQQHLLPWYLLVGGLSGEATYTISLSGEANPGRYPV